MNLGNFLTPIAVSIATVNSQSTVYQMPSIADIDDYDSIESQLFSPVFCSPIRLDSQREIVDIIASFASLKDNWDGNNAVALKDQVLINAKRFINSLPEIILKDIDTDNITPTPYGSLVLDWDINGDVLSVEIGDRKIGFFTDFSDGNNLESNGTFFNQNSLPVELLNAFDKLYKSAVV